MEVLSDTKRVYLDYNATTPPAKFLLDKINEWFSVWGNPSSVHRTGQLARSALWSSKVQVARFIGCRPLELVVSSGASEANNMAIKGLHEKYFPARSDRNEIIMSTVEHPSVKAPMDILKAKGMKQIIIPVSKEGKLDERAYKEALSEKTFLVSIMYANNETGHVFPIHRLSQMARKAGAFFHCDAVQALGKRPVNLQELDVDTASFSAHKTYALKGTGLLYCRKGILPESLIHGGPQERTRRAGTENILGMLCFGAVCEKGDLILKEFARLKELRDQMEKNILSQLSSAHVIGSQGERLPNTSAIYIPGVDGETLLMNMDLKGYSFSVGSACHSGSLNPSRVLISMGFSEKEARSTFRVSLGLATKKEELDDFVSDLTLSVKRISSFSEQMRIQK